VLINERMFESVHRDWFTELLGQPRSRDPGVFNTPIGARDHSYPVGGGNCFVAATSVQHITVSIKDNREQFVACG
jgi:hypothetical protein